MFLKKLYLSCLEKVDQKAAENATDDSSILELCGEYVKITEIGGCNMKITRPEDLIAAEAVYRNKRTVKII